MSNALPFSSRAAGHPTTSELADFAAGRLSGARLEYLAAHVAGCEFCCELLAKTPTDRLVALARDVHRETASRTPELAGSSPPGHSNTEAGVANRDAKARVASRPADSVNAVPVELQNHPRYEVLGELGRGGMGVVYHARHRMMHRDVALKAIHPQYTSSRMAVERFRQEVRAAAKLTHPNIVAAWDAEQAGELHFLVMEYIDGQSLSQVVRDRGPLPVAEACDMIRQACAGLQHAHEHGLTHRDIKPQNLMRTALGQIRILDFGLARLELTSGQVSPTARTEMNLTAVGMTLGTPDFMAPEQAIDASSADARSDIYSLGCTLFLLLTATIPFSDGSSTDGMSRFLRRRLEIPSELRSRVPAELVRVLERMTADNPADRFPSARAVADALGVFCETSAVAAVDAVKPVPPTIRPERRRSDVPPVRRRRVVADQTDRSPDRGRMAAAVVNSRRRIWFAVVGVLALSVVSIAAIVMQTRGTGDALSPERPAEDTGSLASAGGPKSGSVVSGSADRAPDVSGSKQRDGVFDVSVLLLVSATDFQWSDLTPIRMAWRQPPRRVSMTSWTNPVTELQRSDRSVPVDVLLSDADPADFDALIIVGGAGLMHLTEDNADQRETRRLVLRLLADGKVVGAIGAGPGVLASLGVLDGVPATGHPLIRDDVRARFGVTLLNDPVICSGQIITGRQLQDTAAFMREVQAALAARSE